MIKKIDTLKAIKIIIALIILCIIVLLCMILFWKNNTIYENTVTEKLESVELMSMMLETTQNSGMYEMSTDIEWPDPTKYEFNYDLSSCENGGTLTWNETDNTVTYTGSYSDKCYVYFDLIPPDVTVTTNNTNITAYNASTPATLSCTDATSTYNQQYQAIEISDITSKYATCVLTYSTPSTKTYLNDYVTSLAGSTSGDGKVVDEGDAYAGDYSSATTLSESDYGTISQFYSSSASSTSGTSTSVWSYSDNKYTTDADSMTSGTYYNLSTTVQTSGYYQVCYAITSGHSSNYLYVYVGGTAQYINGSNTYLASSTSASKSGCIDLGYIASGTTVKFTQRAYSSSSYATASMSIYLQLGSEASADNVGIRYEGKNPDNYVWFNNELWRIIGVFDESSHGVSGENLVKIIRETSLPVKIAWDRNGNNDWSNASLYHILNNYYYNSTDGTDSGYCYAYSTNITGICDFTYLGINSTYRSMVQQVTWHTGGYQNNSGTAEAFYIAERSTNTYSDNDITVYNYVGLIYPSDFGYASLESDCSRSRNLGAYNTSTCSGENWIIGKGIEITMTHNSIASGRAFYINGTTGTLQGNSTETTILNGFAVRPVLYLDSSVYIVSGSGTRNDPYVIGM